MYFMTPGLERKRCTAGASASVNCRRSKRSVVSLGKGVKLGESIRSIESDLKQKDRIQAAFTPSPFSVLHFKNILQYQLLQLNQEINVL
jgi:hypothetical protein